MSKWGEDGRAQPDAQGAGCYGRERDERIHESRARQLETVRLESKIVAHPDGVVTERFEARGESEQPVVRGLRAEVGKKDAEAQAEALVVD
jgi:hypothetical protein